MQITNGLFTVAFFISLLVCCVGFAVYQMIQFEEREPVLGVCRAMGMRLGELRGMLVHEMFLLTAPSIAFGCLCARIGSRLFGRLLLVAYLPQRHSVAVRLVADYANLWRIPLVIALPAVLCARYLLDRVGKMKIARAIKQYTE